HQGYIARADPVLIHAIDEGLPVAGAAARIYNDHHIAIGGKELSIPAVGPFITPLALRPAMDEELDWILFVFVEAGRLEQKALNFSAASAAKPERFHRLHGDLGQDGIVHVAELRGGIVRFVRHAIRWAASRGRSILRSALQRNFIDFAWRVNRELRKDQRLTVRRNARLIVRS